MTVPSLSQALSPAEADKLREDLRARIDFLRGDFTLSSGKKSDFYFNGKTTTLRPDALYCAARLLLWRMAASAPNRAGGLTLGADALTGAVVCLSHATGQNYEGFIVRKEPKNHGSLQWIEGPEIKPGDRVAIIEDVITTGASSLRVVERVLQVCPEAVIVGVFALVDRQDGGEEALRAAGIPLASIFTKDDLL